MPEARSIARGHRLRRTWNAACGHAGALLCACLLLGACHRPSPTAPTAPPVDAAKTAPAGDAGSEGVTLTPEQVEKIGVATQAVTAVDHTEEAAGYGLVFSHDTVAEAVAELATAEATARLSRSALARAQKLAGTPGAVSADVLEGAAQKTEVDAAALTLATQKLSSMFGMHAPWSSATGGPVLKELANGTVKLVRVTFPFGVLGDGTPPRLHVTHLGESKPGTGSTMTTVWNAPADASVPGRSFFALLKGSDAGEGERLQAAAPVGDPVAGAVVPAAAVVMSDGKYWCYVEKSTGKFARIEVDASRPTADGYFVTEGVAVGDKVVTQSAGQLLSKETGSGAESD